MLALLTALVLAAPPASPPALKGAPPPSEMAKLYFLAGDLAQAVEIARQGLKTEPAKCKPLLTALAEYQYLAPKRDAFTPAQAKTFLDYDHAITPDKPGKLTEGVLVRWVRQPLDLAKARLAAGDAEGARRFVQAVLEVDPKNAEALALQRPPAEGVDAGRPVDGGVPRPRR